MNLSPNTRTMTSTGTDEAQHLPPVGTAQRSLAVFAALMTLPYLVLKVAWLTGSRAGLNDPEFGTSAAMYILNTLTGALDVVALALAVVFFTRRGIRAPAWFVLPPMWIGAGLLGQILIALPLSLVLQATMPTQPVPGEIPPIASWVYAMVYAGFAGLGIGLLGAFAIYARQRWGHRTFAPLTGSARLALVGAAVLTVAAALAHLAVSDVDLGTRLLDLTIAAVTAGALVMIARPGLRIRRVRIAVVLAFVGTGALAAWGTYLGVVTLVPNELVGQTETDWATVGASGFRMVAGFAGAGALRARLRRP